MSVFIAPGVMKATCCMRWMWIDRFLEFQSGRRAVARKNISLVQPADNSFPLRFVNVK